MAVFHTPDFCHAPLFLPVSSIWLIETGLGLGWIVDIDMNWRVADWRTWIAGNGCGVERVPDARVAAVRDGATETRLVVS
jgi:hypothetical protein